MRRAFVTAVAVAVAALAVVVPGARTAAPALPAPSLTLSGELHAIAASGYRIALAVGYEGCGVSTARLVAGVRSKAVHVRGGDGPCGEDSEATADDVWLGRDVVGAEAYDSPSPHGESFSLWQGRYPTGPLRPFGGEWGWTDSSDTYAYGCFLKVATGGGLVAVAPEPNTYGIDEGADKDVTCPAGATTTIRLTGGPRARLTVDGSWRLLATDGKRLVLSRIDRVGRQTGELSYVGLDGRRLATPRVAPGVVKDAYSGWLAPEGLVLSTKRGLVAPRWRIPDPLFVTVAYGRVFYLVGKTIHVRRIADGRHRVLLTLPKGSEEARIAAGSFGLAVGVETAGKDEYEYVTRVYRIGWKTIDAVLPAR